MSLITRIVSVVQAIGLDVKSLNTQVSSLNTGITPEYTPAVLYFDITETTSTLSAAYNVGMLRVFKNGSRLRPSTHYTATDGVSITFATPLVAGDKVDVERITRADPLLTHKVYSFLATAGQTVINSSTITGFVYNPQDVTLYRDGWRIPASDYTATNGTSITLSTSLDLNDDIIIDTYIASEIASPVETLIDTKVGLLTSLSTAVKTNIVAAINELVAKPRVEVLTANRNYYVRTDGSDSNDGLSDYSGGAFLTIQKALDVCTRLFSSQYTVTINVGAGTFNQALIVRPTPSSHIAVAISGAGPTSTFITGPSTGALITMVQRTRLSLSNLDISGTTNNTLVAVRAFGHLSISNVRFGTGYYHIDVSYGAQLSIDGNYTINGASTQHIWCAYNSIVQMTGRTVTFTGSPNIGTYLTLVNNSTAIFSGNVYTGTMTGTQYNLIGLSVLTKGAEVFPGTTGSKDASSQIL